MALCMGANKWAITAYCIPVYTLADTNLQFQGAKDMHEISITSGCISAERK